MQLFENRFVVLFLILLAALSGWLSYFMQNHQEKNTNYGNFPDSMAFNLKLMDFDASGFLNQIINSKQAMHYPNSKKTDFTDVTIQIANPQNNPSWFITAPTATADDKGEKVIVHGLVTMQQDAYSDHFATTLITKDVTVFTDKKYLATAAPIQLIQTGLKINAVGAWYDYDHQILQLLHQVQAIYQPTLRGK